MIDIRPPRWILTLSYFVFTVAGFCFSFWGPHTGLQELLGWGFWIWNWLLIFGGLIGAFGAWTHKFRIEIIASPMLVAGLGVYSSYMMTRIRDSLQPGVVAGLAAVFFGAALLFGGKGLAIWIHKIRVANDVHSRAPNE